MRNLRTVAYRRSLALALAVAVAPLAAWAQEDDAEETGRARRLLVEIQGWGADPSGLGYEPVSRLVPSSVAQAALVDQDPGGSLAARYRFGFVFGKSGAELVGTWFGHETQSSIAERRPGQFLFGQQLSFPLGAGFSNNSLADGYLSDASALLRDLRIDYYHPAFRGPRIEGRWFLGVRRVAMQRKLDATYLAIGGLLPPFEEPRPNLAPQSDTASLASEYTGHGFEGGLDLRIPLVKDKLWVESALSMAVLHGKVDASYAGTNWVYVDANGAIVSQPYSITLAEPAAADADQVPIRGFLAQNNRSMASSVLELALGVRWRILSWLEFSVGARMADFSNVGIDLIAEPGVDTTLLVRDREQGANYEGVYTGFAVRF